MALYHFVYHSVAVLGDHLLETGQPLYREVRSQSVCKSLICGYQVTLRGNRERNVNTIVNTPIEGQSNVEGIFQQR